MNATKYEPMKGLSNGTRLETFALVTTEPNELVSQIHERLALILHPKDYNRWLDFSEVKCLIH
jgi:putative SOS response-associated peptidase YedK